MHDLGVVTCDCYGPNAQLFFATCVAPMTSQRIGRRCLTSEDPSELVTMVTIKETMSWFHGELKNLSRDHETRFRKVSETNTEQCFF